MLAATMLAIVLTAAPNPYATEGPCTGGMAVCQVHLAIGTSPSELRVSWVSRDDVRQPAVQFGTTPTALNASVNASTQTYTLNDMCQPTYIRLRGWEDPGFIHHGDIDTTDLIGHVDGEASTGLYYRVGDASGDDGWSEVFGPVGIGGVKRGGGLASVAFFGDMGTYAYAPSTDGLGACDDQTASALLQVAHELDAIVHVGDIAYANDGPQSRWRYYMEEIAGTAALVPWMVGCGNHDCLWEPPTPSPHGPTWPGTFIDAGGDGGQCGVAYDARFRMPGDPAQIADWAESRGGTRNNLMYAFNVGLVHFVMISSEHDLSVGSTQYAWLAAHLPAVDRGASPFVVLGLHRPIYSSTVDASQAPETAGQRTALEPLLLQHRVTAVVAGHYHQYERSCAIGANSSCVDDPRTANATVHILAGIAGVTHDAEWVEETPAWVAKQVRGRFGYARFDVANYTHVRLTVIENKDGSLIDEAWLVA